MVIDDVAKTAHVFGDVIGGIDSGQTEWNTSNGDLWHLDFTFTGITIDDALFGFWTAGNTSGIDTNSTGTLTLKSEVNIDGNAGNDNGRSIGLADYANGTAGWFNIGGPNPQGPYVSSWLADTTYFLDDPNNPGLNRQGACCKDFGYRAVPVPEPGTILLFSTALLGLRVAGKTRKN